MIKKILSTIFTLLFGTFLILTILIFTISDFASKENIIEKLKETDLLTEVKKIRNSGSTANKSKLTSAINDVYTLADQFSISEEIVDKIIDSKATKEIIGASVGNLTDYVINGKQTKIISDEDIYNIINDNLDDILKTANLSVNDSRKEKFLREIKKQLPDIVSVIPTSEDILGTNYNNKIKIIQKIFSNKAKIIVISCLIISILIIIILNKEKFAWLTNISIALLISGLTTIGISLLMPSIIVNAMNETDLSLFATSLTDFLTRPILYSGTGLIILSFVLLTFYKIINKKTFEQKMI